MGSFPGHIELYLHEELLQRSVLFWTSFFLLFSVSSRRIMIEASLNQGVPGVLMLQMQTGFTIGSYIVQAMDSSGESLPPHPWFSLVFDVRAEEDSQDTVAQNSEAISL